MAEQINLDLPSGLPQTALLHQLVPTLWQRPGVEALWLEGSLGRGNADLYSDVDLYIGVTDSTFDAWRTLDVAALFGEQYAAHHYSEFAEDFIVYHVYLAAGVIYDLHIQPQSRQLPTSQRLILACRDDAYRAQLVAAAPAVPETTNPIFDPQPLDPATIRPQLVGFWMNADKGRKVLYRGQDLTSYTGLHLFRQMLTRLLFIEQTGADCGDLTRPSIHGLKAAAAVLGESLGNELGELMGPPMRNRRELWAAQAQLQQEVARVGRVLAERYEVDYPAALEKIVVENWTRFGDEFINRS